MILGRDDGDAEAARGAVAAADGGQVVAHAAAAHLRGEAEQRQQHRQEQVMIRDRTDKREIGERAWPWRSHQPDRGAGQRPVCRQDARQLGRGDSCHREIMPAQPEGRQPHHHRQPGADRDAERCAGDRRPAPLGVDDQAGICAHAEIQRVANRDLPGIAAQQVPGGGGDRRQQHQRADPLQEHVLHRQRPDRDRQQPQDGEQARQSHGDSVIVRTSS